MMVEWKLGLLPVSAGDISISTYGLPCIDIKNAKWYREIHQELHDNCEIDKGAKEYCEAFMAYIRKLMDLSHGDAPRTPL